MFNYFVTTKNNKMKKISLLTAFVFALVSLHAQQIVGSGNLKQEVRQVGNITGVVANGSMEVTLLYGNDGSIKIEADDNILPNIESEVKDGVLHLKGKNKVNMRPKNKIKVVVSLTTLTRLALNGSGSIKGSGNFSNQGKTDIGISGSGLIELSFANLSDLNLAVSGSGDLNLKSGQANSITAAISGSGNINASAVTSNNVTATISGSGDIRVLANKSLDARVSGSGNVYYKGVATNINSKTSGSGKVIKA
jgi:hypothetical protein